jgi:hypothetical protein
MILTPDQLERGKSLCDMHDGLSILESRIPGFRIETDAEKELEKAFTSC